jgi:hypothetical protein
MSLPFDDPDTLIPDKQLRRMFGNCSQMWIWRNERRDPDFPPRIMIAGRNYRRLGDVIAYRNRLIATAVNPAAAREPADTPSVF